MKSGREEGNGFLVVISCQQTDRQPMWTSGDSTEVVGAKPAAGSLIPAGSDEVTEPQMKMRMRLPVCSFYRANNCKYL